MSQNQADRPADDDRMRLALIAAVADNGVIGAGNRLPWHLPADLRRFKSLTMGKPMIMGRLTYESIGRPLPGRTSIVLTHDADWKASGVVVVHEIDQALAEARHRDADEVMVIGGAAIYALSLPLADRIYLTQIHQHFDGDTFFPPLNESEWLETAREDHGPADGVPYGYSFVVLNRRRRRGR